MKSSADGEETHGDGRSIISTDRPPRCFWALVRPASKGAAVAARQPAHKPDPYAVVALGKSCCSRPASKPSGALICPKIPGRAGRIVAALGRASLDDVLRIVGRGLAIIRVPRNLHACAVCGCRRDHGGAFPDTERSFWRHVAGHRPLHPRRAIAAIAFDRRTHARSMATLNALVVAVVVCGRGTAAAGQARHSKNWLRRCSLPPRARRREVSRWRRGVSAAGDQRAGR